MTPEAVLFAIRGLIRVGTAARDAYEQKVRDSAFPMPNVDLPTFETSDELYEFFTRPAHRDLIKPGGRLAEAWEHSGVGLGLPRTDPESKRRLVEAYLSVLDSQRSEKDSESDFRKQRLAEEKGAHILLSQWAKGHGSPDPIARVALSMADVVLEYIGVNPAIFGVGGNGEKFVAGLTANLRQLLPDPDKVDDWAPGEWSKFYFAERAITIFLHAGFKTIGEYPELFVEEEHYQDLVRNVAMPLVEAFSKDPATRPSWVELRDTLFGPMAGAALTTLAEHQSAFLGRCFEANQGLGAVTQALFLEMGKGDIREVFEKTGLVRIYQATLGVAVERPELFLKKDGNPNVQLARKVLSSVAAELRDAPPPFKKGLAADVAVVAIRAVGDYGAALLLDENDPWEKLAGKAAKSVLDGIAWGLETGGVDQVLDRLLSREQAVALAQIFLEQASLTPGMLTGDDAREEIKTMVAVVTSTMSRRGAILLSPEDWLAVAQAVAAEAARNPGRLFNLDVDDPGQQLAARVIRIMLSAAADSFEEQGRAGGTILFGETLLNAIEYMLREIAGASEKALKRTDEIDKLARRLNDLVKIHPGKVGSRQWLNLFTRLFSKALEGGDFSNVPDDDLLNMLID